MDPNKKEIFEWMIKYNKESYLVGLFNRLYTIIAIPYWFIVWFLHIAFSICLGLIETMLLPISLIVWIVSGKNTFYYFFEKFIEYSFVIQSLI